LERTADDFDTVRDRKKGKTKTQELGLVSWGGQEIEAE
jgi:hypothetical protein